MLQPSDSLTLIVSVGAEAANDDEIDALTGRLRAQIAELDVESVAAATGGPAPPGSKSGELAALGTLLVSLLPSALPKALEFLQSWVTRDAGRTVKVHATVGDRTFDIEYAPGSTSAAELKDLLTTVSDMLGPGRADAEPQRH